MKQRWIAKLLIVVLILSSVTFDRHTTPVSYAYDLGIMSEELKTTYKDDETGAFAYVEGEIGTDLYKSKEENFEASIAILRDHGKVVYIDPDQNNYGYEGFGDYEKGDDGEWYYRYLGHTWDENTKVTNPYFPNLAGTTTLFTTYGSKNWVTKPGNFDTWEQAPKPIREYMLEDKGTRTQENGQYTETHNLSVKDLVSHKLIGDRPLIDEMRDIAMYQATSTLKYWGSARLHHRLVTNNKEYYRTVDINPVPFGTPVMTLTPRQDHFTFAEGEQTKTLIVDAEIKVNGFQPFSGWDLRHYINTAYITVDGEKQTADVLTDKITSTFSITLSREEFITGIKKEYPINGSFQLIAHDYFLNDQFTGDADAAYTVLVNPGEVEPDFDIFYNGESVKDGSIPVMAWQDFNLTLVPDIQIYGENEVTSVVWAFESNGVDELKYGNNNVNYIMNELKKASHLVDGTATFTMTTNLKYPVTVDGVPKTQIVRTGTVDFVENPVPEPPKNLPPVAKLKTKSAVRVGSPFMFSGTRSYDPDGEIVDYKFTAPALETIRMFDADRGQGIFFEGSSKTLRLTVTDNDSLTDETTKDIELLPPLEAEFVVNGIRKVNRAIILDASKSIDAKYFPIDSYEWTITPLEGQSPDSVKWESTNTGKIIRAMLLDDGAYNVTLKITADCTYPDEYGTATDSITHPIMIQPDLAPVAGLTLTQFTLRDRMDGGRATIEIVDSTYSPDNDKFSIQWFYAFDSDNDGSVADETFEPFGTGLSHEKLKVDKVGNYYFYNVATEIIPDADTIPALLPVGAERTDDAKDLALIERQALVENVAPVISTSVELEKNIDLLVLTDESGSNYTSLISEMDKLRKELFERKIGLKSNIVRLDDAATPKQTVGMKMEQYFNWHRNWYVNPEWALYRKYDSWRDTNIKILPYAPKIKGGVVETKTGTITDMLSFPTYPQAYGEFAAQPYIEYYKSPSSGSHNYYLRNLDVLVYNQPYDYLGRFNYSGNFYVAESMYDDKFTARFNNTSLINVNSFNDMRANPQFMNILYPNVINPSVDSGWTQGSLVSETDVEFIVPMIESYVNAYSGSENDKHLILAIADGRNVYLPDSLKQKIVDEYGFKVYFSIDEFWGEFTPKVPGAVDVKLQDGALYALTEYGNQLENYNGTVIDTVYFKYQERSENPVDYENSLEGFVRVDARTTGIFELADINGYREGLPYVRPWNETHDNNSYKWYDPNGNRQYADIEHRYYIGQSIWDSAVKTSYEIGSTWTLPSGALEVSKLYSISNQSGLVETQAGELYFVGNNVTSNATTGHQKAVKLNLNGIQSVYAMNAVNKQYGMTMQLIDSADIRDYEYRIYHGLADVIDTLYLVKDLDGKYALLHTYQPPGSLRYGSSMYTPRPTMRVYYMDDLNQFELTETQLPMDPDTFNLFDRTNPHGILQSGIPLGTELADEETRDAIASFLWNYMEHDPVTVTRWILADNSGNLYVNGEKMAVNASVPTLRFGERDETLIYVDTNGEVYGKGQSDHGELGRFGVIGSFIKVFNSPYTLNATYNTSDFASVFDFTSQSPAYQVVNRGLYSNIMAMILGEYDGYGTTETILIEVGDTVDVSGTVLDYEGDPIYDKRIDAVHDHTYFDNSEGSFIPPENFDQAIVIDKPGRMELRVRAQDNPVGSDERFAQYRYWNKDNTVIEVIAHRKPFAVLGVALVPQGDGTFNFVGSDNGSYDLDHSVSRADKGIVEKRYYYRKELQPTWTEFNGTLPIENGVDYQIALRVKDLEGAWSDYDIVDIRIDGEPFILNASITPPYPTGIPAGDTVTLDATVFSYKAMESVTADINGVVVPLIRQSLSGMESVYQATYKLPETLADKDFYDVLVTAKAMDGTLRLAPLKLNVSTPISLVGDVSPYSIKKGQTGTITAQTSLYAKTCVVDLFDGTAAKTRVTLAKSSVVGDVQNWSASYSFNQDVPDGVYNALFTASTANGNVATYTDTFEFVPNQPPVISFSGHSPELVYVGDDVEVNWLVSDPDGDMMTVEMEYSLDGADYSSVGVLSNVGSNSLASFVLEGVQLVTYYVRASAVDSNGFSAASPVETILVADLSVAGNVSHTSEWEKNRVSYNQSKSGTNDSPRPATYFWPGEMFVLSAQTTQIDSSVSDLVCDSVVVDMLGQGLSDSLSSSDGYTWSGELWNESLMSLDPGNYTFRFTATYSNGTVRVDDVTIVVNDDESYYQLHRDF